MYMQIDCPEEKARTTADILPLKILAIAEQVYMMRVYVRGWARHNGAGRREDSLSSLKLALT